MQIGQIIKVSIYGKLQPVKVVAIHGAGTIDVQTKHGDYFRLSGFAN